MESVCKNAGRCINVGNSHKCECQPGYTGSYCKEMVDECKSNPCRNGATCKDYQGTYECIVSNFSAVFVSLWLLLVFVGFKSFVFQFFANHTTR